MDPKNVLKMPEGVTATGPVMDATEAYLRAVIALPEILVKILEEIERISNTLSIVALYAEKRGVNDGLISPDDLCEEDDGQKN